MGAIRPSALYIDLVAVSDFTDHLQGDIRSTSECTTGTGRLNGHGFLDINNSRHNSYKHECKGINIPVGITKRWYIKNVKKRRSCEKCPNAQTAPKETMAKHSNSQAHKIQANKQ